MTRLTLEIKSEHDLAIVVAFLKLLDVKVLEQEKKTIASSKTPLDFYKGINVNLANFKFDRDEANER